MDSGIDLLNLVFSSASEGIIISDKKGNIISANPMAEVMFGYERHELEGLTIEDLVPQNVRHKHHGHRAEYLKHPNPRPMGIGLTLNGERRNGSVFPIEISLSHFERNDNQFVAAFVNDITERKKSEEKLQQYAEHLQEMVKERTQELEHLNLGLKRQVMERRAAENALRKSQKLHELIAKNFPAGTVSILNEDLEILFIEGKMITELEKTALINKKFISKIPEKYHQLSVQCLEKCVNRQEQDVWHYENGEESFICRAVPIAFDDTTTHQILVVEENITELKKAEKDTQILLEKERELSEMKSRFVSMASHEFRTPLSTILSSTNLIAKYQEANQQEKRDKHLNRIRSSVKNLTEILNDFLSLEKIDSGAMEHHTEEIMLPGYITEIIEEINSIKKVGQEIALTHNRHQAFTCDSKLLKNVLINLLSNAIKYSPEGSLIQVELAADHQVLRLTINDQGIGIPEQEQTRLFERFFRAKNAFNIQGTGLGLHIVNKYVALMSGSIQIQSAEGKGTSVIIEIPNGKEENTHH